MSFVQQGRTDVDVRAHDILQPHINNIINSNSNVGTTTTFTRFCCVDMVSTDLLSCISEPGSGPVRPLELSVKCCNRIRDPKETGMVPVRAVSTSSSLLSRAKLPMDLLWLCEEETKAEVVLKKIEHVVNTDASQDH